MEETMENGKLCRKKELLSRKILELEAEITRKQNLVSDLKSGLSQFRDRHTEEKQGGKAEKRMSQFLQDVCVIMKAVVEDEAYIQPKYATQTASLYYKIEKDVFEGYIQRLSGLQLKEFTEFCAKLSFIKSEKRKYTFPSGNMRVYYLNKGILDEMIGD